MPMVPEAVYAMLACARIGAVHRYLFLIDLFFSSSIFSAGFFSSFFSLDSLNCSVHFGAFYILLAC